MTSDEVPITLEGWISLRCSRCGRSLKARNAGDGLMVPIIEVEPCGCKAEAKPDPAGGDDGE